MNYICSVTLTDSCLLVIFVLGVKYAHSILVFARTDRQTTLITIYNTCFVSLAGKPDVIELCVFLLRQPAEPEIDILFYLRDRVHWAFP